jgi:hypothetical protein
MRTLLGKLTLVSCIALAATGATGSFAQAADPAIGTWKMNAAKSKFSPGPAPKSAVVKWEADAKGVKNTSDLVNADGSAGKTVYTAAYDGKDYPMTGSPMVDTVSLKREGKSVKRVDKKAGKEVQSFDREISADGKTMTVKHKGKDAKGVEFNNVFVLEKQ